MKALEIRKIITPTIGIGYKSEYKICILDDVTNNMSQNMFLHNYITILAKRYLKSRENYVENYRSGIHDACGIYFGTDPVKIDKLFNAIEEKFKNDKGQIIWEYVKTGGDEDAVMEYDPNAGETNHLILFNDIEVAEGQEYTAYLPGYSEEDIENMAGMAADTDYTLFLGTEQISISEELTNEAVFNAYYDINAGADSGEKGIVFGSGIHQYGTFAKVTAIAYGGYEFVGWYEGENLVSKEEAYRFRVSKDIELTAAFKEDSPEKNPEETPKKNPEVTLTNTTDEVIHNWAVAFDLPYAIENVWNGRITSYENGVYTIQNAGYNWDIEPGGSVTFGIYASAETETIIEPAYYTLIEKPARTVKQDYQVVYKVNSDWGTAFNGQIEVKNVSSEEIFDWTLEFDCDYHIHQFRNAQIVSRQGNHYVIKNKGYNAAIGAGQALILGFEADCGNASANRGPAHYTLTTVDMKRMQ